jgi:hypothetical protein
MMFAKQITKEVAVGPETVTIRKLSGRSLQKAREAQRSTQVQNVREIGPEMIKAFRAERAEADAAAAKPEEAPIVELTQEDLDKARKASFAEFDRDVVLVAGIVSWTAKDAKNKAIPVNEANIGELDEETSQLLHDEILDLSLAPVNADEVTGKG